MAQIVCPHCNTAFNVPDGAANAQCPNCGNIVAVTSPPQFVQQPQYTPPQQFAQQQQYSAPQNIGVFDNGPSGKSRGVAALLAFLLGGFGAHYFYVGKTGGGFLCILLCLVTCGVWGIILLIQCIMFITMTHEEFERKFVNSSSSFPIF